MKSPFLRGLLSFFLVLVLTVAAVATLSTATAARSPDASARYVQEQRGREETQPAEISARLREEGLSPLLSVGAFALVLVVPGGALFFHQRAKRQGRTGSSRRYVPRADMSFPGN